MNKLQVSNRGQNVISSPIRKFLPLINATEAQGVKVFKLNVGDPDLSPSPKFLQEIKKYNKKTLGYAPSPGIKEHLLAWQEYYKQLGIKLETNQILPTVGCAEAIMFALQAVADQGDEVIVFEPFYVSYKSFSVMTGIKLVPVTLNIEKNFVLENVEELTKKITNKTKAIVIINPDNPTGKLWSREELDLIVKVAVKNNLFIISDETYREIRFSGKPYCMLENKQARENIILVDSVSKRFSMPGARIGCICTYNMEVMQALLKFAQARLSAGTLEQLALVPMLKNSKAYVSKTVQEYKKRQAVVAKGLNKIPGVVFKPAQGAFYQAVKLPLKDAEEFVKFMITEFRFKNQTVIVTPMKDFYLTVGSGVSEVRIAYVINTKELATAMELLRRGLEEYISK